MGRMILHRCLMIIAFGAMTVSVSEFWFYKVGSDVGSIGIVLAYGVLGYAFLVILAWGRVRHWAGLVVAASILGLLIETVPVPVAYSGLPFTIVWTSLAWHMLLTVLLGWYLFKKVMTTGSLAQAAGLNLLMGVSLGLWNSYAWNAVEDARGAVAYVWQPTSDFAAQFLFGYILFVGGHIVFERVYRKSASFCPTEVIGLIILLGVIAILTAYASGLWVAFPVIPLIIGFCLWALRRARRQTGDIIAELNQTQVPLPRYVLSLLIPIGAIFVYACLVALQSQLEINALVILTAGPISVWLWGTALWKCLRQT